MPNHIISEGGSYPTKKEILDGGPLHTPSEAKKLLRFKNLFFSGWSKMPKEVRFNLLEVMVKTLAPRDTEVRRGDEWSTYGDTIYFGENPSIISCLHEIGHVIHGDSELDACRYSVHLFKEVFPKSYAQLTWKGHMLVKKKL